MSFASCPLASTSRPHGWARPQASMPTTHSARLDRNAFSFAGFSFRSTPVRPASSTPWTGTEFFARSMPTKAGAVLGGIVRFFAWVMGYSSSVCLMNRSWWLPEAGSDGSGPWPLAFVFRIARLPAPPGNEAPTVSGFGGKGKPLPVGCWRNTAVLADRRPDGLHGPETAPLRDPAPLRNRIPPDRRVRDAGGFAECFIVDRSGCRFTLPKGGGSYHYSGYALIPGSRRLLHFGVEAGIEYIP